MLVLNKTTVFKIFAISTAMIKAGYVLMGLSAYYENYIENQYPTNYYNDYYGICGVFLVGVVFNFLLTKNYSRYLLLMFNELIFVATMIIPISTSFTQETTTTQNLIVYGLSFGGGISFMLYPLYALEHFFPSPLAQKNKLVKRNSSFLMLSLWFSLGLGVIYYYVVQDQLDNITWVAGVPMIILDNITPYVFGSLSIITMVLLSILKYKETLQLYLKKRQTNEFDSLIQEIYQSQYHQVIQNAYGGSQVGSQYQNLVNDLESNASENGQQSKRKLIQDKIMYFLPIVAGMSQTFNYVVSEYNDFVSLINSNSDYLSRSTFNNYYYLYLLILIPIIILGSIQLLVPQRKYIAVGSMTLAFLISFYLVVIDVGGWKVNSVLSLIQVFALFGGVASSIFSIPLLLEEGDKVVMYFMLYTLGTYAGKVFINNAYDFDSKGYSSNIYNKQILSMVSQFFCIFSILLIRDY